MYQHTVTQHQSRAWHCPRQYVSILGSLPDTPCLRLAHKCMCKKVGCAIGWRHWGAESWKALLSCENIPTYHYLHLKPQVAINTGHYLKEFNLHHQQEATLYIIHHTMHSSRHLTHLQLMGPAGQQFKRLVCKVEALLGVSCGAGSLQHHGCEQLQTRGHKSHGLGGLKAGVDTPHVATQNGRY